MSNLKSSSIPNSSSEARETNLQSNNQFLINLGFINPSAPPNELKRKIRNDKESVEKKEVRNVRGNLLDLLRKLMKRKEKMSKVV